MGLSKARKPLKKSSTLKRTGSRLASGQRLGRGVSVLTAVPKKEGIKFEEEIVYLYGRLTGERVLRQRGSGAQWYRPGDVITPEFFIECKERSSLAIRREWIEKNVAEAVAFGNRVPLLAFKHKKGFGYLWIILNTKDLPPNVLTEDPELVLRGGKTQVTIKKVAEERFYIQFKNDDNLYVACTAADIFCNHKLFSSKTISQEE